MKEGVKCLATRRSVSLNQSMNILKTSTEKHSAQGQNNVEDGVSGFILNSGVIGT